MNPSREHRSDRSGTRVRKAWWIALAVVLVGVVSAASIVVFVDRSGIFASVPTFPSLRAHPDASIVGTVAYSVVGVVNAGDKQTCVEVVAAGGGVSQRLFCVSWGHQKSVEPALRWLADGRLEATSQDANHWRKVVTVATGAVTDEAWASPRTDVTEVGPQGQVVESHTSAGRLRLTMSQGGVTRTLLTVAVPPTYSLSGPLWSPSGRWFTVVASASSVLLVTTGATASVRFLVDGAGPAVTDRSFARLAGSS